MADSIYEFSAKSITGEEKSFKEYEGKALLIVNTASECGFTNQYEGLENLQKKYKDQGFVVLGFPCNQFGGQEPGSEDDIKSFCETRFQTTFPLYSKVEVNGDNAHPIFKFLKKACPGLLGSEAIKWNFTKFLIGKDGKPIKRFAPKDKPESLEKEIQEVL